MSKITIANINKTNVPTPSGGRVSLFSDSSNNDNPSVKYPDGSVKDLTDTGGGITGGTYVSSASTITLNNSDGTGVDISGITTNNILDTHGYIVDAVNGDNSTGVKGSYVKPFATIEGAESVALSGETIRVITDIAEANRGKDGLTYIFENNSTMSYPSTSPAITGLDWNSLWTDQSGTDISYTVIGGRFTIDSYWNGVWRRSVVRLTSASKVLMIDTEYMEVVGDDGWNFYLEGDGCTIDVRANGDIVYAWMLVRVEAPNTTCNVYSKGSIRTNDLGYGSSLINGNGAGSTVDCSNTKLNLTAERSITCGGHYVGTMRGALTCNSSPNAKSTFIINTPLYEEYDKHINKAGDEKGTIGSSNQCNHYVQFNVDVFKLHHDTSVPSASPYYGGHSGVTSVSSSTKISFVVDLNVRLLILGVGHRLDYSRVTASTNKVKAIVNYNDTTIVYTDPSLQNFYDWKTGSNRYAGSVIDTRFCNFSFNGTTKVIINPLAITAGQVTFGTSDNTEDNAYIIGEFISNGSVKSTSFVDSLTGASFSTGIPKMVMSHNSIITEYAKYENLL